MLSWPQYRINWRYIGLSYGWLLCMAWVSYYLRKTKSRLKQLVLPLRDGDGVQQLDNGSGMDVSAPTTNDTHVGQQ